MDLLGTQIVRWEALMLRLTRLVLALATLAALWPAQTLAQIKAGVVTNLQGSATAARSAAPQPVSLKFKDDVLQNDRIVTGERSIIRMLLGGNAVVTVRERSSLTITEVPGGKSTIDLDHGKIAVAVAKERMRPGESLEVRTPNAVAAVRGTAFIIEVVCASEPGPGAAPVGCDTTNAYGFGGLVPITFLSGQTFNVGAGNIAGGTGSQLATFGIMTPQQAQGAGAGVLMSPQNTAAGRQNANEQSVGTAVVTFSQDGGLPQVAGGGGGGPTPPTTPSNNAPLLPGGTQTLASATSGSSSSFPKLFETNYGSLVPGIATCDDCVTNVNFGFSFPFRGQSYGNGELSTNGSVSLGGSNGASFVPSVSAFLNGFPRISVAWADHNDSSGSGNGLKFNSLPGRAVFTWDATPEFGRPGSSNTFQLQLRSDGSLVFAYVNLNFTLFGHNILTGVTPGNGASDPGSTNFASRVPFSTSNGTVYQFFSPGSTFNFNGNALIFTPNGSGGWDVADPGLQVLFDGSTREGSGPLFDLKGLSLTFGSRLYLLTSGAQDSLSDSVLRAVDSNLTLLGGLLRIDNGGQLTLSGSNPLALVSGGSLDIGTGGAGHLFDLVGRADRTQVDAETGLTLGTDQPLRPGINSPVFEATNGAVVTVAGSAYRVDTALLEATAPLIAMAAGSSLTTSGHTVDLVNRAKVSIPNDAVAMISLNASVLNVNNANLVNVAGGSQLSIAGSLLSLSGGSTLSILNGLLLNVTGGSRVGIGNSLVSFSGSGNLLSVTNSFAPTAIIGGVPVYGPVGSFQITSPTALAGLGTSGTIKINGVALTPTTPLSSLTGSLVAVQGSGAVKVGK
jgi:hypothetical protein